MFFVFPPRMCFMHVFVQTTNTWVDAARKHIIPFLKRDSRTKRTSLVEGVQHPPMFLLFVGPAGTPKFNRFGNPKMSRNAQIWLMMALAVESRRDTQF